MTDEQAVKQKYPEAKVFGTVIAGKQKFRIESGKDKLSGWKDFEAQAWQAARLKLNV